MSLLNVLEATHFLLQWISWLARHKKCDLRKKKKVLSRLKSKKYKSEMAYIYMTQDDVKKQKMEILKLLVNWITNLVLFLFLNTNWIDRIKIFFKYLIIKKLVITSNRNIRRLFKIRIRSNFDQLIILARRPQKNKNN